MTLGEGKRKVLMLIDEYSSGGQRTEDQDIAGKMADFFDLAQRNVAQVKPILAAVSIPLRQAEEGLGGYVEYELPGDFLRLFRVWKGGAVQGSRYPVRAGKLLAPAGETGTLLVEYCASPAPITPETPDGYVFPAAEDAAACMPYFVAAQQLAVDLAADHTALLDLYDRMLLRLDPALPESGGGRVRQKLYRR